MGRAKRLSQKTKVWLTRQWLARREPRVLPIIDRVLTTGVTMQQVQELLADLITERGVAAAEADVRSAIRSLDRIQPDQRKQRNLAVALTRALRQDHLEAALTFAESCLPGLDDPRLRHTLVQLNRRSGNCDRALLHLDTLDPSDAREETRSELHLLRAQQELERQFGEELQRAIREGDDLGPIVDRVIAAVPEGQPKTPAYRFLLARFRREIKTGSKRHAARVITCGEALVRLAGPDPQLVLDLCDAHVIRGQLTRAGEALALVQDPTDERFANRRRKIAVMQRMLEHGFEYAPEVDPAAVYTPAVGRVLYLLHNSLPYDSGGYATRTHGLLSGLTRRGWDMSGVTRPGYPQDRSNHREKPFESVSRVDGIAYRRLRRDGLVLGGLPLPDYLAGYTDALIELMRKERPSLLHAAANYFNGVAANAAARALGIKSVYEVRGLWEVTRRSREPEWGSSESYQLSSRMELEAALGADLVICITQALKEEMVSRGVPADKIVIVPNGVDVHRFLPRPRNQELAERLGLAGKKVIGYIGSVVDYEGLDLLMRAIAGLRERGVKSFGGLIVGDGAVLEEVKAVAAAVGVTDLVVFTGRVPHDQVEDYYSIVDVAPFPRKSLPVTEMVSPLKPFEAMAMNKIVVASNVAALAEIIVEGVNGYLFQKDSVEALTDTLERLLRPDFDNRLTPRDWVVANRDWNRLSGIVDELYRSLVGPPTRTVRLEEVELRAMEPVLAALRDRLGDEGAAHLRRDDYARWSFVADMIPADAGSLLDVGVGLGQFVNAMAARGGIGRIVGVDIKPHGKFTRLHDGFQMDYVSIADLPYADREFDVVTCMETIEHLPNGVFERGVAHLRRVCKKQLIVTVPFREEKLSPGHLRRFDLDDLQRLFPSGTITLLRRKGRNAAPATFWAVVEERL